MSKKTFKNKKGEEWSYELSKEAQEAIARLHDDIRNLEAKAPDYGVGK
tara:strand:- start:1327 stop:1470 length:144 start_codon:yes stop_codon:yes gene_type:complete